MRSMIMFVALGILAAVMAGCSCCGICGGTCPVKGNVESAESAEEPTITIQQD